MPATITTLRNIVPIRALTGIEALRVAERQAGRLLELCEVVAPPIPETIITLLPRLQVERMSPSPVSGATQWSQGRWLIVLSGSEPLTRQRFSLAHEFKHILDHPFIGVLYPASRGVTAAERGERICDHFAACLLMPRSWVKKAWGEGMQEVPRLARRVVSLAVV